MPRKKQSKGKCTYCEQEMAKSAMTRHLLRCQKRLEAIEKSENKGSGSKRENLYHLRVQDVWGGNFWLDLEMKGASTLEDLDSYLRGIWLECCGHLSQFSVGGWHGSEIPMSRKAGEVFDEGVELIHIYDFGTSSETMVKVQGIRIGKPITKKPIELMARNLLPEVKCTECENLARWFCQECVIEEDSPGTLCDEHAKMHPHDNYGEPIPLVNSPRLGMCGYTGPAEPPY
jgi:hypothetical protein